LRPTGSRYRATTVEALRGIGSYRREPRQAIDWKIWSWLMIVQAGQRVEAGPNRCAVALVFLPFVDCTRQLLKARLNVTHHQAPIFALTLPSLVVDNLADPFERTSQSRFHFEDNR
jgi:hypothetical protein